MNSSRPNLFSYATKELSQDALICWLIAWAGESKGGSSEEKELRCCGVRFVRALLNHKRDEMDLIKLENVDKVEIYRQEQGIDILARINDEHVLLVEDKTDTDDHSDQLSRYYTNVVEGRTHSKGCSEGPRRMRGSQRDSVGFPTIPARSGGTNQQIPGMDTDGRQRILVGLGRILSTPRK